MVFYCFLHIQHEQSVREAGINSISSSTAQTIVTYQCKHSTELKPWKEVLGFFLKELEGFVEGFSKSIVKFLYPCFENMNPLGSILVTKQLTRNTPSARQGQLFVPL